jgi:lysophospholipase L1-like esterase
MTKPVINSFSQIAPLIVQEYESYLPTAFDDTLTMLQKVNKVIQYCDSVGKLNNDVVTQWNTVMEWVMNDGLNEDVQNKLDSMTADGTFYSLINQQLFSDFNLTLNKKSDSEYVDNQLLLKRDKNTKLTMNDMDSTVVSAMTGGATVTLQSIPQDGSVTPTKTNAQIPNTIQRGNLYTEVGAVYDKYIANDTGAEVSMSGAYYITIPVTPNTLYFMAGSVNTSLSQYGCFADSGGTFVSTLNLTNGFFVSNIDKKSGIIYVPNDSRIAKIKLNYYKPNFTGVSIIRKWSDVDTSNRLDSSWLMSGTLSKRESPFISTITDYLDRSLIIKGIYGRSDLTIASGTTFSTTPPISVNEGEVIEVSGWLKTFTPSQIGSRGLWLDSNYSILSSVTGGNTDTVSYTVPTGARYLMLTLESGAESTVTIKRTDSGVNVPIKISKNAIYPPLNTDQLINYWQGKNWTSFGDSITYRNLWQPYVISSLGFVHTNCGIGSTALAGPSLSGGDSFWMDSRITAVKNSNPDVLTIMGGTNDQYYNIYIGDNSEFTKEIASKNTNLFKGAYSYIIETLLAWKPSLRIFLMTTPYTTASNGFTGREYINATTGLKALDFAQATRDVAQYYGLPCIDIFGESGINYPTITTFLSDNVHPNDSGAQRMAQVVIERMRSFAPLK